MNKMIKGALATGIGAALLIGGGGTLAVWNTTAEQQAGSIANGDLQLTAAAGTWKNSKGTTINLASYKAVPGDKLTFTQPVTVALDGDLMKAHLTVTDKLTAPETATYLQVGETTLKDSNGATVTESLTKDSDGTYTASVTVTFLTATTGTAGTKATNNLGKIGFKLEQDASSTQP
jgi:alternate signal-mediated exported protein